MNRDTWIFLALCGALLVFLLMASFLSKSYSLDRIKSKTVGDGQHGTARWATPKEIGKTYHTVPFRPRRWRKGKELPTEQGLILGSVGGGIMGVVPGVMGVAAFAPPLDEAGNSVKAQKALAYIAGHLNLNIFGTTRCVMAEKEAAQA